MAGSGPDLLRLTSDDKRDLAGTAVRAEMQRDTGVLAFYTPQICPTMHPTIVTSDPPCDIRYPTVHCYPDIISPGLM